MKQIEIPQIVKKRAEVMGAVGVEWLCNLNKVIAYLEQKWQITVDTAMSDGTHAFAAKARGENGEKYVLKIDMPDGFGHADFKYAIHALEIADGHGYVKLFAYDEVHRACLLEELGKPLKNFGYPVNKQIEIICETLKNTWIKTKSNKLQNGVEGVDWFRTFLNETWEELNRPCPEAVLIQAYKFLDNRQRVLKPDDFVLIHGDAHNTNILEDIARGDGSFKLIDPEGIYYEKACDLGVIMREWQEEYQFDPVKKGIERCEYLHKLTGVDKQGIWEWGFLQNISTGLLCSKINESEDAKSMLKTATAWINAPLFYNL